ncbi:MAG TPA: cyclic nucleotide-binding domain-containing protein [bacterium]|nr:cyclic nucleotide-binding domain-containing protein [Candidatus Omnitrophota bacterium]HOJ59386.1 cyclic nucleotide-binding domain-containing protein [bacterium]HOL94145.1 cyclic nucleotide-binding domain-containing protein [bacterium]HPP01172.1 cyclic nucleotide-binding domain-containing protein [bacterium]HXK93420.1 cyclic nucleotide-binding domain-containing protein [bacterium]
MDLEEILRGMKVLQSFTDEQIGQIASIAQLESYATDSRVEQENDLARAVYLVHKGCVSIVIKLPPDRHVAIYVVKPGELFGWSAAVAPYQITASSLCMEPTELIALPHEALLDLLNRDSSLKAVFMEMIAQVIRNRLKYTRMQLQFLLHG